MNTTTEVVEADPKIDSTALTLLARAEIDGQIATAHAFPRGLKRFIDESTELVSWDVATAESCIYSLPRGKNKDGSAKMITGASVRFAEILMASYGNCRTGGRVVSVDRDSVTAQGVLHDLEKNVMVTKEVSRSIVDKYGKRYNADMINVTGNAAISVALRNAILTGIPQAIWGLVYEKAQLVAIGDVTTLADRRSKALEWFGKVGVSPAAVFAKLEIEGVEDIGLKELETLIGLKTAIKGGVTPEEAFAPPAADKEPTGSDLARAIDEKRKQGTTAAPAATPAEDTGKPVLTLKRAMERLHAATTIEELNEVAADFDLIQKATDKQQAQMLYDTKVNAQQ